MQMHARITEEDRSDNTDKLSFTNFEVIQQIIVEQDFPNEQSRVVANFDDEGAMTPTLSFRLDDFTVSKPLNPSSVEQRE